MGFKTFTLVTEDLCGAISGRGVREVVEPGFA